MLSISNLHVSIGDTPILKGLPPDVPAGERLASMAPHGAGALAMCYAGLRRVP